VPQDQRTTVDIDLLNTVNCDGGVVFAEALGLRAVNVSY
jgi:hypothetical protein